ncbi:arginine--tRNA ligase [Buchnera aphidicola]|uniref:Arginine--tRNA ligase n=1 Tax=Buchnera aphidicola subsp. Acyrthosiphon pisum (strain Tuc7) TaxID=561501 RepID=SYR_BUCAT|nr:arginine--tRNA ligase [Buchnera aphidicola]B8D7E4.1 RecName: Full=Arginine--tRNA ligase; AltName: Full=Arginyl-tRNA synthetase; Short=ArgRS [Buchnera aphidicola str. Tuc7 (Acyrthosiphon pisum)]ACL30059.1 arginyl-tRNA synthetase [Buchnera aphidicola str. Tuc7 (Acyrthosiphon pisum)]ADP66065.1 arginyl-tRNA synthetase [Buchnera aphidicola str. LL01 (Acyrthosiphon pisum)]ADP66639.1 arginyl-tRNA synthetase [Buchnera aphidicola str. TLW03 (Acyrthosiphon pisum)]
MNLKNTIKKDIQDALIKIAIINCDPVITLNKKTKIGHYQLNNLIKIANISNLKPFELANRIILNIKKKYMYKEITFSQPGFINFLINPYWISEQLEKIFLSPRLGINHVNAQNIVIDYSSPNIAKEMHIGHLRSTIIGDVMARILDFLGHNVIRANHIGDWGTQFGMLIAYLEVKKLVNSPLSLMKLEEYYCKAKKKYDIDQLFAEKSREYVVKLQNGDQYCYSIWKKLVSITMLENCKIYKRLHVTLKKKHTMGESIYNKMLPNIIEDLKNKKIAIEKNGSTIVFLKEFKNRLGEPMGVVIQKKDKGFLYSTTDIACLKYRYQVLHADRIIYYTDSRQHQHLLQAWTIAKKALYISQNLLLEHHIFGMMLSKDKRPFKTRDGDTIKLSALLDEATERAMRLIKNKQPNLSKKKLNQLSNIIGVGAVKYADLSKNRNTNYIFDWNEMLSFEGNTAPYIQYAYTRIVSILKKSNMPIKKLKEKIFLTKESEINLAIKILEFEEIILLISQKGTPHILCKYLYHLATSFSHFYENCSILFPKKIKTCKSRLKLSILTAKTLKKGLNMLGIRVVKKM